MKHCDEYIDDQSQPECLRVWLHWARSPAHGINAALPHPVCYADHANRPVRLVMASRFGDVGITYDLDSGVGYNARVDVCELTNFRVTP